MNEPGNLTPEELERSDQISELVGIKRGDKVVIHRWMLPEVVGTVDFFDFDPDDWTVFILGIVEDDGSVFAVDDVVEVNGAPVEGGGAW